jgi:hypothetical protein
LNLHAPDGILVWSSRIAYGLKGAIIGKPAETLIHPCDRERWLGWFSRAAHNRERITHTVRIIVPAKPGWITVHGVMGPIVERGQVKYVSNAVYDATFTEPTNPCVRFMLTPTQRKIVAVLLAESHPVKSQTIAARIGLKKSTSTLRSILASLADREILKIRDGGYEIHRDFRPLAVEFLQG